MLIKIGDKNVVLLFEALLHLNKNNYQLCLDILDRMDSTSIIPPFKAYISASQALSCWKLTQLKRALVALNSALLQVPEHDEWNLWKQQMLRLT